jgi:glutaredoxin
VALGVALLLGLAAWLLDARHVPSTAPREGVDLELFQQPGCPHCEAARRWLEDLVRRRLDLVLEARDVVPEPQALLRLRVLAERSGAQAAATPALYVRGTLIIG